MGYKTSIPPLSVIVAVDEDGGFGKNGKIPWKISDDMKHFKEVTTGSVCIMGRKTYEDMLEMVKSRKKKDVELDDILPNRQSFVVTSDKDYEPEGATAVTSIRAAIEELEETDEREIFVIGGLRMYIEALTWTTTIYMTIVKNKRFECDRFFPIKYLNQFTIVEGSDKDEVYFLTYKRKQQK